MEWEQLSQEIREIKEKFDKSYKCVSQNRNIQKDTLNRHANILVQSFNDVRILVHENRELINKTNWSKVSKFLIKLRSNLINVKEKHQLDIFIPTILNTPLTLESLEEQQSVELNSDSENEEIEIKETNPENEETEIKETDLNDLTIPALITLSTQGDDIEQENELNSSSGTIDFKENIVTMADQIIKDREYVKQVSSSIPEFDGNKLSLNRFLTALRIVDRTKGDQEDLAIEVIKSKITGTILYKVQNEPTIKKIIDKLKDNVKGESPDVLKAKLLNMKQKGKTASQYATEMDNLRKQLEAAFIDNGLDPDNAEKFSTKESISAMIKNCEHEKLKVILEAGNFVTFNDVMGKYIHCSTEMTGSASTVLFQRGRNNRGGSYPPQRGRGNGRGNYNSYNNNNSYNRNNNRGGRGYNRGRYNNNRGNNQNRSSYNNNNNVRVAQDTSGNSQTPPGTQG